MAGNTSGAMRANASAPGDCKATTLSDPQNSAAPGRRRALAPSPSILSFADDGSALRAVLRARTLKTAHAAARDGLDALAQAMPNDVLELEEAVRLSGRTPSTVRRWAAAHRLGRKLGGRWLFSRSKVVAFVGGGA